MVGILTRLSPHESRLTDVRSRRVYDERSAKDPAYPSVLPSAGDAPEYQIKNGREDREDSPMMGQTNAIDEMEDFALSHAPPG